MEAPVNSLYRILILSINVFLTLSSLKFSIKEADIVLSNTIGVFLARKIFFSGTYHENHNVKSEIRISKFETNSNNQNHNDLKKAFARVV
jgi:hypothetical protein